MTSPAQRPRVQTHPTYPITPASPSLSPAMPPPARGEAVAPRQFADARSALDTLLQRAADLATEGVEPRLPAPRYLEAIGPVLRFVATQPLLHDELSLSREICGAALRIAEEILGRPASAPGLAEPLFVPPPRDVRHEEALRSAVLLLNAHRAALDTALGDRTDGDRSARAEFAVAEMLSMRDAERVGEALARFLLAAERWPHALAKARIKPAHLVGLAAHGRALRHYEEDRARLAVTAGAPQRARILHLALEYFFDRYAAAVCVRLIGEPAAQREGLALVPKAAPPPPARKPAPEVKPAPLRSLAAAFDYAMCQVTRSGRLVFT